MREISDWNEITGTFPEPAIMVAIACRTSLTAAAVDITTIVPFRVTTEAPSIDLLAPAAQLYEFAVTWIDWTNSRYLIPAFGLPNYAARAANATTVALGTVDPPRPVRKTYTRSSFVPPASQITTTFQTYKLSKPARPRSAKSVQQATKDTTEKEADRGHRTGQQPS